MFGNRESGIGNRESGIGNRESGIVRFCESSEVFCGRGFSPDAFRSAAAIGTESIGTEAPPTKTRR
ncbi:DUF6053 domain-containing protein [Lysobacter gummosus]|uniref:DUF6053 domain-containing protein n=1 Tax=Lysobacter gummosus TaxID=262324 RepID=UPI001C9DD731